jgi:hypothetical protein
MESSQKYTAKKSDERMKHILLNGVAIQECLQRPFYSTASPFKKASSELPALTRTFSVPCTLVERTIVSSALHPLLPDLELESNLILAVVHHAVDVAGCDPDFCRPTSVQDTNAHNRSLRFVSDTRKFWKTYSRAKMTEFEGGDIRRSSSACTVASASTSASV